MRGRLVRSERLAWCRGKVEEAGRGAGIGLLGRVSGEKEKEKGSWAVGAGLGQGEWCWAMAWGLGRSVKELACEGKRENGPQWMFLGRTGFGLETGLGCRCWVRLGLGLSLGFWFLILFPISN